MEPLINWIYQTPVSTTIRDVSWIIPVVQSIHIAAIAALIGSALVTELRLAGVVATDESVQTVARRFVPWLWGALAVLAATGLIMATGEPDRVLGNWVFWLKMALILAAAVLTYLFRRPLLRDEETRSRSGLHVKALAWVSLLIWIGVIFCGRWIAYAL